MVDLFPRKVIHRGQARDAEAVGKHLNFHILKAIQEFPNPISDCPQNSDKEEEFDPQIYNGPSPQKQNQEHNSTDYINPSFIGGQGHI